jgi:NTP pyrophosphatase (non-canonical NTP hydrolase)
MTSTEFLMAVRVEFEQAQRNYPPMITAHDALDIIREEIDELTEAVRHGTQDEVAHEAIQCAAMLLRYAVDLDFVAARQNKKAKYKTLLESFSKDLVADCV